MSELYLKNQTLKRLKKEFPGIWLYHPADRFSSGIPDIIGCLDGRFFAIELKFGKGKPTRLQLYVMDQIERAGGLSQVCYSVAEAVAFVTEVKIQNRKGVKL